MARWSFLLAVVALLATACSGPMLAPTPIPPTPTPTFEEKRADVVAYLKAYNMIQNALTDSTANITFPRSSRYSAADLIAFNSAVAKLATALDGSFRRLDEMTSPVTEPDTAVHLAKTKQINQAQRQILRALSDAISAGNETGIVTLVNAIVATASQTQDLDRATEQLMLKYNVGDADVSYRR